MKYLDTVVKGKKVSQIALGCMRISNMSQAQAQAYVNTALECGYNYFDHADIYGNGRCEEVFGDVLRSNKSLRDQIVIATKCGIRESMYDFSYEHIISSVDASLKRLGVEHIDLLLLHRPDILMDPNDVKKAFDELEKSGKVGAFGVSNHSPMQIELLKKHITQDISVNQLQLSVTNATMLSSGANVNTLSNDAVNRDGYVRDYCRLNDITIQPWSPFQYGFFEGTFLNNEKFPDLCWVIGEMAHKYGVSDTAIAIAWLLRLPEKMQPVIGTTRLDRIRDIAKASDIEMDRADWYKIYKVAGHALP